MNMYCSSRQIGKTKMQFVWYLWRLRKEGYITYKDIAWALFELEPSKLSAQAVIKEQPYF